MGPFPSSIGAKGWPGFLGLRLLKAVCLKGHDRIIKGSINRPRDRGCDQKALGRFCQFRRINKIMPSIGELGAQSLNSGGIAGNHIDLVVLEGIG